MDTDTDATAVVATLLGNIFRAEYVAEQRVRAAPAATSAPVYRDERDRQRCDECVDVCVEAIANDAANIVKTIRHLPTMGVVRYRIPSHGLLHFPSRDARLAELARRVATRIGNFPVRLYYDVDDDDTVDDEDSKRGRRLTLELRTADAAIIPHAEGLVVF